MTCEIFLCQMAATHKARVRVPGLPISVKCVLCTGHVSGEIYVNGNILESEVLG